MLFCFVLLPLYTLVVSWQKGLAGKNWQCITLKRGKFMLLPNIYINLTPLWSICHYTLFTYLLTYFYLLFLLSHSQILCLSDIFKQIYRGNATLGHSFWWGIFHFYPGNLTWAVRIPPHSLITLALSVQNNYPVFLLSWSIQLEWAVVVVVPPVCSSPPAELGWPRGNNLKEFITGICLADE